VFATACEDHTVRIWNGAALFDSLTEGDGGAAGAKSPRHKNKDDEKARRPRSTRQDSPDADQDNFNKFGLFMFGKPGEKNPAATTGFTGMSCAFTCVHGVTVVSRNLLTASLSYRAGHVMW